MKKTLLLIFTSLLCLSAGAQISRWVIRPQYENLRLAQGAPFVLGDSLDNTILWDFNAKRIAMTKDSILPFVEGKGVAVAKGTDKVTGFFTQDGKFYRLDDCSIAHDMPYFSDGYLLLRGTYGYRIIDGKGKDAISGYYEKIYPFNNGFAVCQTFENVEKRKDAFYAFITTDGRFINFSYGKKKFDHDDVQFLSSISDNGKGIAVIKEKAYYFDSKTLELAPIMPKFSDKNVKHQVEIIGREDEFIHDLGDSIVILCKNGKDRVQLHFDPRLLPTKIVYADTVEYFHEEQGTGTVYSSSMTPVKGENGKWGVERDSVVVLPAQFDSVAFCVNDYVAVRSNGKYGMLYYDETLKYNFEINNGDKIPFRHKKFNTNIRLNLPPSVSAKDCSYDIDVQHGCVIDKISRERKDTENGNYLKYDCILAIPEYLTEKLSEVVYPIELVYDGVKLPVYELKTQAWYLKYIDVDLGENGGQITISKGDVSFVIKLTIDRKPGEIDYPFEVKISADSLRTECGLMAEKTRKCYIYGLVEGVNNVNIIIEEEGCPPSMFPFEIKYVKPRPKTDTSPAIEKEAVVIEKKVYVPVVEPEPQKELHPKKSKSEEEEEEKKHMIEI